ncbi:uncharacterized protein LOC118265227 [Spodoptera frugiperda]|uniref:Uncharacterized protein LOC118265227 n=1 Tax=Spodoptera frugiperda TaxID=7108 RepID=A0A9R0CYP0_SPOFR|nr:uncharacterized protein LOC118265227 [Spodoptera frugiperda]
MEQFIDIVKRFPILWNTHLKEYHNLVQKDVIWESIVEELNNPDIPDVKTAKNEWKKLRDSHRESLKRIKAATNNWKYAEYLKFLVPYIKNRKRTGNASINNQNTWANTAKQSQNTWANTSTQSQNTLPGTSTSVCQSILPDASTDTHIDDDDGSASEPPRMKKRKVADVSSLRVLLHEDNNDFRSEQRERRKTGKTEVPKETEAHRHPLNLFFDSMCESTKKLPDWVQRDVKKKLFQIVNEAEENYERYLSGHTYQYEYSSSSSFSSPAQNDSI